MFNCVVIINIFFLFSSVVAQCTDYVIENNGDPIFTVSTVNKSCICNSFTGDGSSLTNLENQSTIAYLMTEIQNLIASQEQQTQNINLIIGGNFDTNPWQRGTSFAMTTGDYIYTADRFSWSTQGVGRVTVQKTADAPTIGQAGILTSNSFEVTTTTSVGVVDSYYLVAYKIEGYDWSQIAQNNLTLSFWIKATVTGTYCVSFTNSGYDQSYVVEYTVNNSNTWEKKTIVVSASPSSGTWDYTNGVGINIRWTLASNIGTTGSPNTWVNTNVFCTSNQVNGLNSTSNLFKITLVQVEPGSTATQFKVVPFQQVLALSQRYYYKTYSSTTYAGTNISTDSPGALQARQSGLSGGIEYTRVNIRWPVRMRTIPNITAYSTDGTPNTFRDRINLSNVAVGGFGTNENGTPLDMTMSAPSAEMWFEGHVVAEAEL